MARSLSIISGFVALLLSQQHFALQAEAPRSIPVKLTGMVTFNCSTTVRAVKVDLTTYRIDFSRKLVNNKKVRLEVDDAFIRWTPLKQQAENEKPNKQHPAWLDTYEQAPTYSLDRFSGKLSWNDGGFWDYDVQNAGKDGRLTICSLIGQRKF